MPAAPSSLTGPAIGQLLTAAQALGGDHARLLPVLTAVPDPRARRGVRHRLTTILGLAVCAVLAGARSFTAISEWAAGADQDTRNALGVTGAVPCESTFRRPLQKLDADALDDAAGAWAQQRTAPPPGARRVIAVDGKTLRGSAAGTEPGRHLLAALDHAHGVVLGQVDVEAKTNEIPMFAHLLDRIDLAGAVVTADALHAQRAHAEYLVSQRGAHYLITVKGNQCATRRFGTSPPQAGQTRREVCWVRWLTWIRKVKGTRACQQTGGWAQVPGTARRGTRAVWRKLDCLNPNLQRQQFTATGMAPVTGARRDRDVLVRPVTLRGGSDAQRGHSRR